MPIEVRLPQLAEAMTAARLGAWLKREGDAVTGGEPILEVETDKTNVEIEAPASGVLSRIHVPAGSDGVMVGALLATILESDEHGAAARDSHEPPPAPPAARTVDHAIAVAAASTSLDVHADDGEAAEPVVVDATDATPVARKIAILAGIDLGTIRPATGSRITKADVEVALGKRQATAPAVPAMVPPLLPAPRDAAGPFSDRPVSAMRRVTAQRLQEAKQTVPHFYLQSECRVAALMDLRTRYNARGDGTRVTVTDMLVFAVARALGQVPLANSSWMETGLRVFEHADIAVAVNTPGGLIAPVVRRCDQKSIVVISQELGMLAERARKGSLKPDDYTGGTFTISNLGMFGVMSIVPIINTPQACILGVGAIEERALVSGGVVVAAQVMTCTLAADHRAIDGATGAEFLAALRRLIEDPWGMLL